MTNPNPSAVEAAHQWNAGEFETPLNRRGNFLTRRWGATRGAVNWVRQESGIKRHIRDLQKEWLGDLSGKRVLDFGCGQGNNISIHMAQHASYYLACDLSEPAIEALRKKLDKRGLLQAETLAGDFLTARLPDEPFDAVYANSVLHAFHPLEDVLVPLFERMTPGGRLVTMEPMQTSRLMLAIRRSARLFRSDAAFNWPLSRSDFELIQQYFEIEAVQGFFGWSKWTVPVSLVPGMRQLGVCLARRMHEWDMQSANQPGSGLWRCNSVTMLLRRRESSISTPRAVERSVTK